MMQTPQVATAAAASSEPGSLPTPSASSSDVESVAKQLFLRLDTRRTGYLSFHETRNIFDSIGASLPPEVVISSGRAESTDVMLFPAFHAACRAVAKKSGALEDLVWFVNEVHHVEQTLKDQWQAELHAIQKSLEHLLAKQCVAGFSSFAATVDDRLKRFIDSRSRVFRSTVSPSAQLGFSLRECLVVLENLPLDTMRSVGAAARAASDAVGLLLAGQMEDLWHLLMQPPEQVLTPEAIVSVARCLVLAGLFERTVAWFEGSQHAEVCFDLLLFCLSRDHDARVAPHLLEKLFRSSLATLDLPDEDRASRLQYLLSLPHKSTMMTANILSTIARRLHLSSYWMEHESRTSLRVALIRLGSQIIFESSGAVPGPLGTEGLVKEAFGSGFVQALVALLGPQRGQRRPKLPAGMELEELDFLCLDASAGQSSFAGGADVVGQKEDGSPRSLQCSFVKSKYSHDIQDAQEFGEKDKEKALQILFLFYKRFGPLLFWKYLPSIEDLLRGLLAFGIDRVPEDFWDIFAEIHTCVSLQKACWKDLLADLCLLFAHSGRLQPLAKKLLTLCGRGVKDDHANRLMQVGCIYNEFCRWRDNLAALVLTRNAVTSAESATSAPLHPLTMSWQDAVQFVQSPICPPEFRFFLSQTDALRNCLRWFKVFQCEFPPVVAALLDRVDHMYVSAAVDTQGGRFLPVPPPRSVASRFPNVSCGFLEFSRSFLRLLTAASAEKPEDAQRRQFLVQYAMEEFVLQPSAARPENLFSLVVPLSLLSDGGLFDVRWYSSLDAAVPSEQVRAAGPEEEIAGIRGRIVGGADDDEVIMVRVFGRWKLLFPHEVLDEAAMKSRFGFRRRKILHEQ